MAAQHVPLQSGTIMPAMAVNVTLVDREFHGCKRQREALDQKKMLVRKCPMNFLTTNVGHNVTHCFAILVSNFQVMLQLNALPFETKA